MSGRSHNIPGMKSFVVHRWRPFGGASIIYRNFNGSTVKIWFKSRRVCVINFTFENGLFKYNYVMCTCLVININSIIFIFEDLLSLSNQ